MRRGSIVTCVLLLMVSCGPLVGIASADSTVLLDLDRDLVVLTPGQATNVTLKLLGDCLVHKKELEHRRYRLEKCCCGAYFVQIDFGHLALVLISVISTRGIVLWSTNWGSDARVTNILCYAG